MKPPSDRSDYIPGDRFELLLEIERAFILGEGLEAAPAEAEPTSQETAGLALSGGGIRSAAFAVGVMQALVAGRLLDRFHYLSSVSGGGYAGAGLTWWLHHGLPTEKHERAGTQPENFPFGSRRRLGDVPQAQNAVLNFIRQHASYLNPTPQLGLLSLLAVVLRSAFLSLSVYFTLLTGAMGLLLTWGVFAPLAKRWFRPFPPLRDYLSNGLLYVGALLSAFLLVAALVYSLTTRFSRGSHSYVFRTRVQIFIGRAGAVIAATVFLGILPSAYFVLGAVLRLVLSADSAMREQMLAFGVAALTTGVGTVLGAQEGRLAISGKKPRGWFAEKRPLLAVGCLIYGMVLGSMALADSMREGGASGLDFALVLTIGLAFGWFSNINYLGAHRMYRDRLMELFTPGPEAVQKSQWQLARAADQTGIQDVCGVRAGRCLRPYHLINTNVGLVDSPKSAFAGRGGDSFVLSPLFVGSASTGWVRSSSYMNAEGGKGMSLPSAMAISGAALNPNTAPAGTGPTRSLLVSAALHLLNLRLGYWAPNPSRTPSRVANFINPGLSALLGRGMREDAQVVSLSDGGHFENLGIYELVRRGVRLIVVADGAEDPDYEFADLANAVERARVDFGVKIDFGERFPLAGLLPRQASTDGDLAVGKFGLSERAFAVATIRYPSDLPGQTSGCLVYIKTTVFPGLPADVLGYKLSRPAFPNESTSDQFFDERQFEAYRELGYYAGWNMLENAEIPALAPPARETAPSAAPISQPL